MKELLAITFVFGVVRLLTCTKIFDKKLSGILAILIPKENGFLMWFDLLIFYGSLVFQAYYWLFNK